jgi:hypothetical protein
MDLYLALLWGIVAAAFFYLSYTMPAGPTSPIWDAGRWAALALALFNLCRYGVRRLVQPRRRTPRSLPPPPVVRPDEENPFQE